MTAPKFNPDQQRVIDAPGRVAAVAGAGAGKTGLLVGRILQSLANGTRPEEILAVTFCTAAAAELRQRVERAVRGQARTSNEWQSILQRLPLLGVTTIHGLCYRIITEHPVESGTGLRLTVQDDLEWGVFREQHIRHLLAELPAGEVASIPGTERSRLLSWLLERPDEAARAARVTRDPQAQILCRLYQHVDQGLTKLKREEGLANFADLERWAGEALAVAQVRAYYAERIREVLVDELQDTSPAQWQILQAVAGEHARVVVVGDERQAIYAFRGGDSRVFQTAQEETQQRQGEVVQLTDNYRSAPAIVAATNTIFTSLFSDSQQGGMGFIPMQAARDDQATEEPVEYHQVTGGTAANRATAAGRVIAGRLQSLLGHAVLDRTTGTMRPARWSDMALLVRSRTHLVTLQAALRESGIPYVVDGGRSLFSRPEVREAIDLLTIVTDPADDWLLISVLRGNYFRWSEEQLLTLVQHRTDHESLWQTLQRAGDPASRRASSLLREWRTLSATRSTAQLLHEADLRTGAAVVHAAQPDGALRLGNLQRLREVLYRWTAQGHGTVASVVQHCQAIRRLRHTRPDEPEAVAPQPDAVQILTVHRAKGLEWPIVAYADAVPGGYRHVPPLALDEESGIVLPDSPRWRSALEQQHANADQEETRLLYVACTRARDHLILCSRVGDSRDAQRKAAQLQASFPDTVVCNFHQASTVPVSPPLPVVEQSQRLKLDYRPGPGYVLPHQLPATALRRYATCPQQFAFHDLAGYLPLAGTWSEERASSPPALTVGDAVHKALQYGWSERQILRRFSSLPEATRAEIVTLTRSAQRETYAELHDRPWQREISVTTVIGGISVHGVIDAYYPESGEIIDYKTDQEVYPAQHLLQMAIYAHATEARKVTLVYLRHDLLYRFKEGELKRGLQQAETLINRMIAEDYSPTPGIVCQTCAYRALCEAAS